MPLVAAAVIAYAAGLLVGFGGALVPGLLAAAAALAVAAYGRDARGSALALVSVAGIAAGAASAADAARCRAVMEAVPQVALVLEDDASPGSYARGVAREPGCSMPAAVMVQRGSAAAGDVVLVRGSALASGRRLVLRDARIGARVGRARLPAWRAATGRAIDSVFQSDDRALARALLVADMRSVGQDVRERFAAAGLVHALSISGLHVGIIAAAVVLLLRALRMSARASLAGAVVVTAGYVLLIGLPPPAVRAGMMLAVGACSQLAQRPTSPWASLALGALAPLLIDPGTVLDLGFQLSVAGMAALVASRALGRRVLAGRLRGWKLVLARELITSTVAVLATAPLVAWTFGRLSVVAPLANLVAAPVIGVVQPVLFLALLAAPVPALGRFLGSAAHPLLALLNAIAGAAAAVPHATVWVAPSLLAAILCGVGAAAAIAACVSRSPGPPAVVGAASLTVALWLPLLPAGGGRLELHALDVGQGDAVALRTPAGRWLLFDAGRSWRGGDAGRETVVPYLRRRGGPLEAFVLSHPHADHVGGAASVVRALRPRVYWDAAFAGGGDAYRESLLAARAAGVEWRRVHPADSVVVDGVTIRFLAPDSAWTATLRDPNEASTVALVTYGSVRLLLVGDAERGEEGWLLARRAAELRADVLKVGHHGSRTSSTDPFLAAVRPSVALVSVGRDNTYGHPSISVMQALARGGAQVLRTDRAGTIVVRTDGERITVEAEGAEWPVDRRATPAGSE